MEKNNLEKSPTPQTDFEKIQNILETSTEASVVINNANNLQELLNDLIKNGFSFKNREDTLENILVKIDNSSSTEYLIKIHNNNVIESIQMIIKNEKGEDEYFLITDATKKPYHTTTKTNEEEIQ